MSQRYTYETCLTWGSDEDGDYSEADVTVSFVVIRGEPETGPTYDCGGTPASDPQIDDVKLEKVNGKPRPWGMYWGYIADEDNAFEAEVIDKLDTPAHVASMLEEAAEQYTFDADGYADYLRDQGS